MVICMALKILRNRIVIKGEKTEIQKSHKRWKDWIWRNIHLCICPYFCPCLVTVCLQHCHRDRNTRHHTWQTIYEKLKSRSKNRERAPCKITRSVGVQLPQRCFNKQNIYLCLEKLILNEKKRHEVTLWALPYEIHWWHWGWRVAHLWHEKDELWVLLEKLSFLPILKLLAKCIFRNTKSKGKTMFNEGHRVV